MKLLKEKYKSYEGARKRRDFENGLARSEYINGYKAHFYRYSIIAEGDHWRVQRQIDANAEGNINPEDKGPWL